MPDLPIDQLAMVREILAKHVPRAKVWAFGSRVLGTAQKFSDLDLAIEDDGELSLLTMGNLRHAFSESDLPIMVDFLDMHTVMGTFRRIVKEQRVEIV